jgi:chromosomal replication initiation ATPase DnaA
LACSTWLFQSEIYGQLTSASNKKRETYRLFMNETALNNTIKSFFARELKSAVLGSDSFINSLNFSNQSIEIPREDRLLNRPTIQMIIKETAQEFSQSIESITKPQNDRGYINIPRKVAMYIAQKIWDYRLIEISKTFGLSH